MSSTTSQTPDEMEAALGARLKALRLMKNLDQITLARQAGIGVSAVKNLEGGHGSTLRTLVSLVRALGREDWLATVAPVSTINPLSMTRDAEPRQRARRRKSRAEG